jgi:hypothetical protein
LTQYYQLIRVAGRRNGSIDAALRRFAIVGYTVLWPFLVLGAQPDLLSIIQKSVAANQMDWNAALNYSFQETDRDKGSSKTYQVEMVEGSPYQTLIALNGKPLRSAERVEQAGRRQKLIAQRQTESSVDKQRRIAKYEADRRQEHLLMQQLTEAFRFTYIGERIINGFSVFVLRATPLRGYQPPNMEPQVLPGMQGQLWIDKKTFQWVKVTARVIRPVSIEGILAQVEPGTYFELEKTPVAAGVWLPKHFVMKSHSKILFMIGHNTQADESYFDYKRAEQQ